MDKKLPPRWLPDRLELPKREFNPRNPNNEPTGHYTGRCRKCGSNNLWDDNLAYGCNDCGSFLGN